MPDIISLPIPQSRGTVCHLSYNTIRSDIRLLSNNNNNNNKKKGVRGGEERSVHLFQLLV